MDKIRISLFNLILILSTIHTVFSQENTSPADQKQISADTAKETAIHSLFTGVGYGNNMVYMGSSITRDKPYYSGSLTYGYKEEFYASVSTYHLSAFDPLLAFHTFSINYVHDFNSWFDISLGLSGYQVNSDLTDSLFSNFFYGDLAFGFDWNILYSTLSVGGIMAEESSTYFQFRNSRYFQTREFINGKAYLSFDPYINMLFGTLTKIVTDQGTTITNSPPFMPGKSPGKNPSGSISTIFSLMQMDFGLPVDLTSGRLTIQAEPGYVMPFYSETDIFHTKGFIFILNCYFRIL